MVTSLALYSYGPLSTSYGDHSWTKLIECRKRTSLVGYHKMGDVRPARRIEKEQRESNEGRRHYETGHDASVRGL